MTDEQLDALERKWEKEFGGKDVCDLIAEVRRLRSFETGPPFRPLSPETASVEWRSDTLSQASPTDKCQRENGQPYYGNPTVDDLVPFAPIVPALPGEGSPFSMEEAVEEIERRFLDLPFDSSAYRCPQCLSDGLSTCQHQGGNGKAE